MGGDDAAHFWGNYTEWDWTYDGEMERYSLDPSFIGILLFISVFVIAMGWMIYFKLIDNGEAGTVGSYTFMIPVLSTIFSMVILKESLTLTFVVGLVLIAGSVYLVNTDSPGKWGNRSSRANETKSCTNE